MIWAGSMLLVFIVGFIVGGVWDRLWYNAAIRKFTDRGTLHITRPGPFLRFEWADNGGNAGHNVSFETFGEGVTELWDRLGESGDV